MPKKFLIICLFFFWHTATAQNVRLLENFDKIPLNEQRFEVEGYMSTFSGFKQSKINDSWGLPEKKYIAIEYIGSNDEEIILFFHDGILYLKRLVLNYSLQDLNVAKEEFQNLKNYIVSNNVVLRESEEIISNKAYGSQIGEGSVFSLTNSTKLYRTKSAGFVGKLHFSYDNGKTTAKIIGYNLNYECTDLSKTTLDAKTGFSSY